MLHDIEISLWFLLPAAIANSTPIFAAQIPGLKQLDRPLDGGHMYHRKEIFGANKTWRGLISGMIVSTLLFWLQQLAAAHTGWGHSLAGPINYASLPTLLVGPLMGFGALGGDALESFFKRARSIPSGQKWFPFDQLDYIIGAILVTLPFVRLPIQVYAYMIVLWFFAHLVASYIGFLLGLKKTPI